MPIIPEQHANFAAADAVAVTDPIGDRVVKHLIQRVGEAQVETWPFQHFYVEGIFPNDVYKQILANLPAKQSYRPFNARRWKNAKGDPTRDRLCLSEGELERIDTERRPFWSMLTEALEAGAFRRAVYAKLSADIAIRLGCPPHSVLDQSAYPNAMLIRDYQDYRIKPHPDGQPRVVTMQFYLPDDGTPEDLGTSLYTKLPLAHRLVEENEIVAVDNLHRDSLTGSGLVEHPNFEFVQGDVLDAQLAATAEQPGPYPCTLAGCADLLPYLTPRPALSLPSRHANPLLPKRAFELVNHLEIFFGGAGSMFPTVHYDMLRPWMRHAELIARADAVLARVALAHRRDVPASVLSHGDQRKLEVALMIALEPKIFMFDEPTAGMSVDEVPVVLDLIAQLKQDKSKIILLVEHKMDVVRSLADRIIVLHNGRLVADGLPAEVIASPVVQEAYLGSFAEHAA